MSTKSYSSKQEKQIAQYLGWDVVVGSGSRPLNPGDIIGDMFLGECKTHVDSGNRLVFNKSVWVKICKEAAYRFRYPVLFVDDGSQKLENTWCMFSSYAAGFDILRFNYPHKFRTNLSCSLESLESGLVVSGVPSVYELVFNNESVCLTRLTTFKEIFYS